MFTNTRIIKNIDVTGKRYTSAVLVKVTNGKGTLSFAGRLTENYNYFRQILLNGIPVMQGEYPECPTCSALLARGYGIENINCPELRAVRDCINGRYTDISNAVDTISPILGLLDSGYYVIADCPQYPTFGGSEFFWNAPDKLTDMPASSSSYYLSGMLTAADGTPAFLYPSQSNSCMNEERVKYYTDIISSPDAPRAIALYDHGFISVLLDGHHKAAAAARLGVPVPCIVIIPAYGIAKRYRDGNITERICFADIDIPTETIPYEQYRRKYSFDKLYTYEPNMPIPETGMRLMMYPKTDEFAALAVYMSKTEPSDITDEKIAQWMLCKDYDDMYMLHIALMYLSRCDNERACRYARDIMRRRSFDSEVFCTAMKILLSCKDEQTEKLFIDYLVDADKHSAGYDLALSYFE